MSRMEEQSSGDKKLQGSFHSKRCKPIDVMRKQLEGKGLVGRTTHDIHSDIMKTVTMMQELAISTPTSGDQQTQEIHGISEVQLSQDEKLKVTSGDKKTPAEMREAADQTIALANTLREQRENQPHHRFAITKKRRAENDTHKDLKQQLKELSSSSLQDLKPFWEQTEIAQRLNRVLDTNLRGDNTPPSKIFRKKDNPAPLNTSERDSSLIDSLHKASLPYGDLSDKAITLTLDICIQDKLKNIKGRVDWVGDAAFPYSLWQAGLDSDPQTGKAEKYLKGGFDRMKKKAHSLREGNSITERLRLLRQLHADQEEIYRRVGPPR